MFSHLGINPLIKLGKEYITSNNSVRLEEDSNINKKVSLDDHKKSKKVSKKRANKEAPNFNSKEKFEIEDSKELNSDNKLTKITTSNDGIDLTDEVDISRRKRRRSSASIE